MSKASIKEIVSDFNSSGAIDAGAIAGIAAAVTVIVFLLIVIWMVWGKIASKKAEDTYGYLKFMIFAVMGIIFLFALISILTT